MMVLSSFPLLKCRQLLGDSREEADNDTDGGGFHVVAELAHNLLVLFGVSHFDENSEE